MKKRMYRFILIGLFASLILFIVGCTEKTEQKTQDENIETIDAVLQNALSGPDDELKKAFESEETIENTDQYDRDHYKGYFANDTAYVEFVSSYGTVLMTIPMREGYTLKINNIEYEKIDSKESIYNFSADIQYQKEGSEESGVEVVTGQVNLNKEHKIEETLIRLKDLWSAIDKK